MTLRSLHRWIGLASALFGLTLAVSGAVLAIAPVSEAATTGSLLAAAEIDVAELAQAIVDQVDGVERIEKTANHSVVVHFSTVDGFGRTYFDPNTLRPLQQAADGWILNFAKDLHRSLLLADAGRIAVGLTAFAMLLLTVSGLAIVLRRMGGWRALIFLPRTGRFQSIHLAAGRIAAFGLLLASLTGIFLSLVNFDIIPSGTDVQPEFPAIAATSSLRAVSALPALQAVTFADFRELVLPYPDDPTDAYQLTTSAGRGYINPYTGQIAGFARHSASARIYEMIYLLHTGQGAWVIALALGFSMLAVPFVVFSGIAMTLKRPKNPLRGVKTVPANSADAIVLVGSEGASTWGFAAELSRKLIAAGKNVHITEMNTLAEKYHRAENLFVLTSTYGAGAAPANGQSFLSNLQHIEWGAMRFAVLGFGDKTFSDYCKFAEDVDMALQARGLKPSCPLTKIDRQSAQRFAAWGKKIGKTLDIPLDLDHCPDLPATTPVQVVSSQSFGESVQAPVFVIRFRTKRFRRLPRHGAGDLLGVMVPGSSIPRYYSLASNASEGWIEICVRKQPGGLCSGYLAELELSDAVDVFVKPNPMFKTSRSKSSLILVGAGAGLAPLVGFLRENTGKRPAHLFWGGRDPKSDFLYQDELAQLRESGQLADLTTAFSRPEGGGYVQARLQEASNELQNIVANGGQILVCGGQAMGAEVHKIFDGILRPIGLNVNGLKQQKRYLEDVY